MFGSLLPLGGLPGEGMEVERGPRSLAQKRKRSIDPKIDGALGFVISSDRSDLLFRTHSHGGDGRLSFWFRLLVT